MDPANDATAAQDARAAQDAKAAKRAKWWAETKMDLKWATALLFVLILAVSGWLWSSWRLQPEGSEDLSGVTTEIFSENALVVPFEVLGVLLLGALIAGVVMAVRDPEGGAE